MKAIKFFLAFLLMLISFLTTGERFVYQLINFQQTFWEITFEYGLYGEEGSKVLIKEAIASNLKESNLDVFYVKKKYPSDYRTEITIYGTSGALLDLQERGIHPKAYKSIFSGQVEVFFKDFMELDNIFESDIFYIVGTLEQALDFKQLSESSANTFYSVDDLKTRSGNESGVYISLALIWGISFFVMLLLTLYDIVFSRKEFAIKVFLGGNSHKIFLINFLYDTIIYTFLFVGLALGLECFTHVQYKFSFIFLMFVIMLLLNSAILGMGLRISTKRDLSSAVNSKGVLSATYIVKFITVLLTTFSIAANVITIDSALRYFRQENFFSQMDQYSFYKLNYTPATRKRLGLGKKAEENIWYEFHSRFGENAIYMVDFSDSFNHDVVLINPNAVKYVLPYASTDLAQKLSAASERKLYIFFHESFNQLEYEDVASMGAALFLNNQNLNISDLLSIDIYSGRSELIGINSQQYLYRSQLKTNPIVIFDNTIHTGADWYRNPLYSASQILYSISQQEFEIFIKEMNMEGEIIKSTNAKDLYLYNRSSFERSSKLITATTCLIFLLEFLVISFIVKLEYTINGVEIAIKKTLGYNLFNRCSHLFASALILIPLCTICSMLSVQILRIGKPSYIFLCGVFLICVEVICVIIQCLRVDKIKVTSILKGARF